MENYRDICFIFNPVSGLSHRTFNKYQPLNDITDFFASKKIPVTIKITGSAGDGKILAEEAIEKGYKYIVACGGDGTVNEVLNGMTGKDAVMGIIPAGTENILARAMNIPINIRGACSHFLSSEIKSWDTGVAKGNLFLTVSGIGLDGEVVAGIEKQPALKKYMGALGFIMKGAEILFTGKSKFKTEIDFIDREEKFETTARLIVIGNIPEYGAQAKVTLKAKPDDGKLDIVVFKYTENELNFIQNIIEVFKMKHLKSDFIEYFTSSHFEITTEPPVHCQIDGELLGTTPVTYSVKHKSVKVKF